MSRAFRRIMYASGRLVIRFNKGGAGATCVTNNNVNPPDQAVVTCGDSNQMTQYTAVHELGHVFVGRTGGFATGLTYFGIVNSIPLTAAAPTPIGILPDFVIPTPQVVMGYFPAPEWVRGNRGWGSAARIGVPCDFQQNPLNAPGTTTSEVDEAAADMFLNWVYSKIGTPGFKNINWLTAIPCDGGTPEPTQRPGDARNNWMSTVVMPLLSPRFPTPTP